MAVICTAMEDYARSHQLTVAYLATDPGQEVLLEELHGRDYLHGTDLPIAYLQVTWTDIDSYLRTLRARRKTYAAAAKKEIRRFEKSGIRIERFSGSDFTEWYDLLQRHCLRKNGRPLELGPGFPLGLAEHLGEDCVWYVARKGATPVGVCLVIKRNDKAWCWQVGIDHEADDNSFTYFNLTYYHLCAEYLRQGVREVYYGNAAQMVKYRRGCDMVETQLHVKPHSAVLNAILRPLLVVQRIVLRRKFQAALPKRARTVR